LDDSLDDKPTVLALLGNVMGFFLIMGGLIAYFFQYQYTNDNSDERWIYPLLYFIPCFGGVMSIGVCVSSTVKFKPALFMYPLFAIIEMLLLMFMCFVFLSANNAEYKSTICSLSKSAQELTCGVAKDGHQICGRRDLSDLCLQMDVGFYLSVIGLIVMAVFQMLLLIATCFRLYALRYHKSSCSLSIINKYMKRRNNNSNNNNNSINSSKTLSITSDEDSDGDGEVGEKGNSDHHDMVELAHRLAE